MTDEAPRRGRPRPQETLERDTAVLELLRQRGNLTRNEVAGALGITTTLAYLALSRLARAKKVKRCLVDNESVWTCDVDKPCP